MVQKLSGDAGDELSFIPRALWRRRFRYNTKTRRSCGSDGRRLH